jgi:integral membrane sensor domain MASE1
MLFPDRLCFIAWRGDGKWLGQMTKFLLVSGAFGACYVLAVVALMCLLGVGIGAVASMFVELILT